MKNYLTLLLSFLLCINYAFSQVIIQGYTYNLNNNKPVSYTSIELFDKSRGTLTNDAGFFELRLDSLPALIKVSCLGFESKMVPVPDTGLLVIGLTPTIILLKEVQVRYKDEVTELIAKARDKALRTRKNQLTGRAFYRQFNRNDSICTEILESFYDVCTNNNGVKVWDLKQARYGIKDVDTGNRVYIYNQSIITRLFRIYSDASLSLEITEPITNVKRARIIYELVNRFNDPSTGQTIAEISYRSTKSKYDSTYGHMFIDEDTFEILKVQGTFIDKTNKLIQPSGWEREYVETIDKTRLDYEVRFKQLGADLLSLDYIKTKVSLFTIYKERRINLVAESLFFVFEIDPTMEVRNMHPEAHDYESIRKTPYDPVFWFNNPIIKRNPLEQRLITEFEQENIIGNLLN